MTPPAAPVIPDTRLPLDLISEAVAGCPDVAALSAGEFGQFRSYLPGRTVPGVRLDDALLEVHIVARYGTPLGTIADHIGQAVRPWLTGRSLAVTVEDILLPGETLRAETEPAADHPGDAGQRPLAPQRPQPSTADRH